MNFGDIVIVIIASIVTLAVVMLFIMIFGHSFRQFNSGDLNYELREENKGTQWQTFVIGLIIFIILFSLMEGCF